MNGQNLNPNPNSVGKNIYTLRKSKGLTQEELAKKLNVLFQAVSKWENCVSVPDVSVLPLLANIFGCSVDSLLGYPAEQHRIMDYEKRYSSSGYYWGVKPTEMCYEVLKMYPPERPLRPLDIACGEKRRVFRKKRLQRHRF